MSLTLEGGVLFIEASVGVGELCKELVISGSESPSSSNAVYYPTYFERSR
jgi:hypothetical protein